MTEISENVQDLLERKNYYRKGEKNWYDICKRVSKNIASIEEDKKYEEIFYDMMAKMIFIPSTPCLLNAGTNVQQLSSCFIIDIDDNIESIMNTVAECAKIFQKSGGAGFNISSLRPKGSPLKNSGGQASGPVSFMRIFNAVVEEVKHGNSRKGALKIDLDVSHPDIFDFIHCKDDTDQLKNMNISVSVTDDFMNAVIDNKEWELIFNDKIYKEIKAKDLWDEIIQSAWKTGEPGLSFVDIMDRNNPNPHLGVVKSSNPCMEYTNIPYSSCLTGDSVILTLDGAKQIKDLINKKELFIYSSDQRFRKCKNIISKGIKPVYKITLDNGLEIKATEDHKFLTENGWLKTSDMIIDKTYIKTFSGYPLPIIDNYDEEYEMYGWLHGDGWYNNTVGISFNCADGDYDIKERLLPVFHKIFETSNIKPLKDDDVSYQIQTEKKSALEKCEKMGFVKGLAKEKRLPKTFYTWSSRQQLSFIRGLFSADGGVYGTNKRQINLTSNSKELLLDIQKFLASIGIQSKIYTSTFKTVKRNPQHRLLISCRSAFTYFKVISFSGQKKTQLFNSINVERNYQKDLDAFKVTNIEYIGEEEVFDIIEVDKTNSFFASGLVTHNCNLGSLNLLKFVDNKQFNWSKFEQYIGYAIRFLDNMISVNKLPLPKIQEMTELIRPIGLGTMGLADTLFALGIPMNSKKGLDFIDKIYSFLYQKALSTTQKFAEERGVYPAWEGSTWEMADTKVHNSSLISIAPNGAIGFIAGVNGGIEPVFSLAYTRRTEDGTEYFVVNSILEQELRKLDLFNDNILNKIIKNNGSVKGIKDIPKKLQNIFVTAMDMTPEEHIRCLERISKYVDLSVSKTINLPKYASVEDVANVYLNTWKTGVIKGITVYRDGSRKDQILSTGIKKQKLERGEIKPAPEESSDNKTVKLYSGCGTLWVTLTKDEDKNIDQAFVNRGSKGTCVSNQVAVSRLISLALRGGIKPEDIVDQLLSTPTCASYYGKRQKGERVSRGSSCPSAIGIVLDKYAKEKEEDKDVEESMEKCPDCGAELLMTSSCVSCVFCGFSYCG